ncbi:hypothetical protein ABEB22_12555 [Thioclava sp. 'Guangxiensis']|uniref:hypothetical protein n=1 Tax=Thioclava sp. 'Guangxiensis' TaxID=3149044 RepID=UPI003877D343
MAEAVVGRMRAVLGMDRRGFTTGLQGARAEISAFATQMRGYAGLIGAAMGAAGVGSLTLMSSEAMEAAAETQRLSTLANTTPEAFQKMAIAARSVGVEQDKLSDIFKDTNDRIGEFASTGGGEMSDFFKNIAPKVGVTIKDFQKLSGPEALQLYARSLEKAGVNQQQMTYYMESMADEATGLVPLLRDGGAGLDEMGRKATALGAIMDKDTIAAFRRAKQAVSEVNLVFVGIRNMVAQELVPGLEGLAKAFSSAAEEGKPLGNAIRTMVDALPRFIAYAGVAVGALVAWRAAAIAARVATVLLKNSLIATGVGALVVAAGELVYQFTRLVSATGSFGEALGVLKDLALDVWQRIGDGVEYVAQSIKAMSSSANAYFIAALRDMAGKWAAFTETVADGMNSMFGTNLKGASATITQELALAQIAAEDSAASARKAAGEAATAFTAPLESLSKLKKTVSDSESKFGDLGNSGILAGDGVAAGADKAKEKVTALQKVTTKLKDELAKMKATMFGSELDGSIYDNLKEAGVSADSRDGQQIIDYTTQLDGMKRLKDATSEWQSSIQLAFSSFLTGASSFKDMLGTIIGKLGEMLMNQGFQSLFSSVGGTGILGGILGALGIGANATGTGGWRGGLTAINEIGGEIVDLPSGTRIIPHDVSNRLADAAGRSSGGAERVMVEAVPTDLFDLRVKSVADQSVSQARAGIVSDSVQATGRAMTKSKSFGSRK